MLRRAGRRIRVHPFVFATGLLVLACVVVVMAPMTVAQSPLRGQTLHQHLAVPAYMDPTADANGWSQLRSAQSGTLGIVVVNVNNGPDSAVVPAWASEIRRMHATGTKVLGYVDTGYLGSVMTDHPDGLPTRTGQSGLDPWISQIEADVNAWYRFYGSDIDGIFFDEGTGTCGPSARSDGYATQYELLTRYVKETHPGAMTALNPGTAVPRCYENSADVLVTFEGSYGNYTGTPKSPSGAYQPLSWTPADPDKIWHIVYGTATASEMQSVIALSKSRNAGYVYVTDGVLANPYDAVPSAYWSQEQALTFPS
jgi:Spherulation-specific family 4